MYYKMGSANNDGGALAIDSDCQRCNDREKNLLGVSYYDILIATEEHARFLTGSYDPLVEISPNHGKSIYLTMATMEQILAELAKAKKGKVGESSSVEIFWPETSETLPPEAE